MAEEIDKYEDDLEKLIDTGKEKGYLTYGEVNDLLPGEITSPDELDDLMTTINTQGIDVLLNRQAAGFGPMPTAIEIVSAAAAGDALAEASLARLEDRIGRALASVVNLLDPDVIVIGGGLSKLDRLYANLPVLVERHLFGGGALATPIVPAKHGDASGVRGAAWLWPA